MSPEHQPVDTVESDLKYDSPSSAELARELEDIVAVPGKLADIVSPYPPEPDVIQAALVEAADLHTPELKAVLDKVRELRAPGDNYRGNRQNVYSYDAVVVGLLQQGRPELATALISASPHEASNLDFCISNLADNDEAKAAGLRTQVAEISARNQAKLRAELATKGVTENMASQIIERAADPDAAATVRAEQWHAVSGQSPNNQELLFRGDTDIARGVDTLVRAGEYAMGDDTPTIWARLLKSESPTEQEAFLDSFQAAQTELTALRESGRQVDYANQAAALAEFADPAVAVRAAERFFSSEETVNLLKLSALARRGYEPGPAVLSEALTEGLITAKTVLRELDIDSSRLRDIAGQLVQSEQPDNLADQIAHNLRAAEAIIKTKPSAAHSVIVGHDKEHLSAALGKLAWTADATLGSQSVLEAVCMTDDAEMEAARLNAAHEVFVGRGLTFDDLSLTEVNRAYGDTLRNNPDASPVECRASLERMCSDHIMTAQITEAYTRMYNGAKAKSFDGKAIQPALQDLPELSDRLSAAGIDADQAKNMFDKWSSRREVDRFTYEHKCQFEDISERDWAMLASDSAKNLNAELASVELFVTEYGAAERQYCTDTFAINHFKRYDPVQLKAQIDNWRDNSVTTRNIIISAAADWNGAVDHVGTDNAKLFASGPAVFFEANDAHQLARQLVAVGARERDQNREPNIDNLMIDAHANPSGLLLGTNGQQIVVQDYLDAAKYRSHAGKDPKYHKEEGDDATDHDRARPQDYTRHLGAKYRVILKACSTAGDNGNRQNIAETMSQGHKTVIEGSPFTTRGAIKIDEFGNVTFAVAHDGDIDQTASRNDQTAPATTYSGRKL